MPAPLQATPPPLISLARTPKLVLDLAQPPRHKPITPRKREQVLADVGNLFGHVARALLQDQFDSVILKVSLGRQVVEHLRADLQP